MYSLYFNAMKVLVDAAVHYEDAQITRYDNELGSVKRFRDVENETISEKIQREYPKEYYFNLRH
jgi:hypothetical protein